MWIDANFDGGNVEVVAAFDSANIQLKIKPDSQSDHAQWFYFRVLGAGGKRCTFKIVNAGDAAYPEAWPDGSIVFSYDQNFWQRVKTSFNGTVLEFEIACEQEALYVALSTPYPEARHDQQVANALSSDFCQLEGVFSTVEGRPIELLRIGECSPNAHKIWIISRQHPGEPMAEWYIEGLLDRLLDPADTIAERLRRNCCFFVVPNMNRDGSIAGNLRTNAAGVDLNRAWAAPDADTSPEVHGILTAMEQTGVDLFLDIHGDEELPFVFAAGCEGIPGYTKKMANADQRFRSAYRRANPDFSIENGYAPDESGMADLSIACNQVAARFGCLSLTIEMPFKDNAKRPDPVMGWSALRSKVLGASVLSALTDYFDL